MKTKLNELLEFPTPFTYKVMGQRCRSWLIRWWKWYSAMRLVITRRQ